MVGNFKKLRLRSRIDEYFPSSPAGGFVDKNSQQCVNREETSFLQVVSKAICIDPAAIFARFLRCARLTLALSDKRSTKRPYNLVRIRPNSKIVKTVLSQLLINKGTILRHCNCIRSLPLVSNICDSTTALAVPRTF